jgi:3-hydroxyacyl-[acyl-carrier-protein] dehydratase
MRDEIKKQMKILSQTAESFAGEFCFDKNFAGFQGHFPEQPVLPGVCLVQAVLVLAEFLCSAPPVLQEMVSAKFFAVVKPDDRIQMNCTLENGTLKASVSGDAGRVAEIKLKVHCA